MDDQKPDSQNTDVPVSPENDAPRFNDAPRPAPGVQKAEPKKKRRGRPLLLLVIMLIAAVGGAVGYYKFYKTEPTAGNSSSQNEAAIEPKRNLYYQVGSKIVKYNQNDKSTSTLTAALPKGAEVLDFSAGDQNWKAIYRTTPQTGAEKQKIVLIENDKPAITLVEDAQYVAAASARYNSVAYTLPADTTKPSGETARTRTFLTKAGEETEEIFTSNPWNQKTPASDTKNYLYTPREISNNGDKLLFNLISCFQCDGPPLAAAFEMDLKSKEVKTIYLSEEPGYVTFNSFTGGFRGYKVIESNNLSLASDGPYELTISQVDTPGAPAKQEFKATENEWANLVFSPTRDYVAIEKKDKTFAETGKTAFDGVYAFASVEKPADMNKLSVTGLPTDNYSVQTIGAWYGECFGITLYERAANNPSDSMVQQEVGAVCRSGDSYGYVKIDDLKYDETENYQTTKVLNHL